MNVLGIGPQLLAGGGIPLAIVFWVSGGLKAEKAFREHRLETSGVFRLTRNPPYAAFMVFMVPEREVPRLFPSVTNRGRAA